LSDTREIPLPFAFLYLGQQYGQVFVNSDGKLTFTEGDTSSSERSVEIAERSSAESALLCRSRSVRWRPRRVIVECRVLQRDLVRSNEPITMEFLGSRLNLNLNERGIVASTYCG
jgi:hypothetical protein